MSLEVLVTEPVIVSNVVKAFVTLAAVFIVLPVGFEAALIGAVVAVAAVVAAVWNRARVTPV